MILPDAIVAPKRGPRSATAQEQIERFCDDLLGLQSRLDFTPSSRGWCYVLEEFGLSKGDFDRAQALINDCRKCGLLPIDFCAADPKRATQGVVELDIEDAAAFAHELIPRVEATVDRWTPIDFWADRDMYVEVVVEKSDLVNIFRPVCREFHIPITNLGGWCDLLGRYELLCRFAEYDDGRALVLLVFGDHDPGGLRITDCLRANLAEIADAAGWDPGELSIERFGLNLDFIEREQLTWIDNLITGSGRDLASRRHPDHGKPYVQDYLKRFGARKVEANALVGRIDAGRELCRQTIARYVEPEWIEQHNAALEEQRQELRALMPAVVSEWAKGYGG